jgi:glycosyltransferase involved in cell wall biosynthesis
VAVVIPAHNAERILDATLRSARGQSYPRLEIIVVDDGSTDTTAQIAAENCAEDRRVRLVSQPNGGVAAARNRGIKETSADYLAPLDADDLWHWEKIERQMAAMSRAGDCCGLVYGLSATIDAEDRTIVSDTAWCRPMRVSCFPIFWPVTLLRMEARL